MSVTALFAAAFVGLAGDLLAAALLYLIVVSLVWRANDRWLFLALHRDSLRASWPLVFLIGMLFLAPVLYEPNWGMKLALLGALWGLGGIVLLAVSFQVSGPPRWLQQAKEQLRSEKEREPGSRQDAGRNTIAPIASSHDHNAGAPGMRSSLANLMDTRLGPILLGALLLLALSLYYFSPEFKTVSYGQRGMRVDCLIQVNRLTGQTRLLTDNTACRSLMGTQTSVTD